MAKKAALKQQQNDMPAAGFRGFIGIVLAYAFLSRAFSTGSFWQYFVAILFFVLGMKLLVRTFKNYYGNNR